MTERGGYDSGTVEMSIPAVPAGPAAGEHRLIPRIEAAARLGVDLAVLADLVANGTLSYATGKGSGRVRFGNFWADEVEAVRVLTMSPDPLAEATGGIATVDLYELLERQIGLSLDGFDLEEASRDYIVSAAAEAAGRVLTENSRALREAVLTGVRRCRSCGCTDYDCRACIAHTGRPCSWISEDLCSACLQDFSPASLARNSAFQHGLQLNWQSMAYLYSGALARIEGVARHAADSTMAGGLSFVQIAEMAREAVDGLAKTRPETITDDGKVAVIGLLDPTRVHNEPSRQPYVFQRMHITPVTVALAHPEVDVLALSFHQLQRSISAEVAARGYTESGAGREFVLEVRAPIASYSEPSAEPWSWTPSTDF